MGDELRGDSLVHLNVRFSTEAELKQTLDFLYVKSKEGISFTGLIEAMVNEVTIVTAIHNIKSNKGSKTAGVDQMKMDKYLQMPKEELIALIRDNFSNYRPKPAKRVYIPKKNGKKRPLGIPTVLDRIIQECVRIIIEPICEARFYPHSYGFRPYRAQKHAVRDIINVINASTYSKDQPVWAVEGDIKGCFDNIDHRILLQKIWRIGIHDKRVIKIIQQMLKAGYIESGARNDTKLGTMQGGILSPLLSNVYLNDFDWYVGRMYMEPHSKYESKPFDQRMTPYTEEGRRIYSYYRSRSKPLPCDRPSVNTARDIQLSVYAKTVYNFEYFMNREYAYNRDKGKCKCCKKPLFLDNKKYCYHVKGELPLGKVNKVQNLVWLCNDCYRMVNNGPIPPNIDEKVLKKIQKYKQK